MRKTRALAYGAICVALIAVCSWISIEIIPNVPFTMQTFAIFLTAALLPIGNSVLVIVTYLLLGVINLPVFAGFNTGISSIIGPTGGYLVGFLPTAIIFGLFYKKGGLLWNILGICLGLVACYALGTAWFMYKYTGGLGLGAALNLCVVPFIIPDLVKGFLAVLLASRLKPVMKL